MIPWQLFVCAVALAAVAGCLIGEARGYWGAVRDLTRRDDEVTRARDTLPRAWLASYRWHHPEGWVRRDDADPSARSTGGRHA